MDLLQCLKRVTEGSSKTDIYFPGEEEAILRVITSGKLKQLGHLAVDKTARQDEAH